MSGFKQIEQTVADKVTAFAGSMWFVYLSTVQFVVWMFVETPPWQTLTLVVSLEAIYLATFVLISQNRQAAFADKRAKKDFEVNRASKAEIENMQADLDEIKLLVTDGMQDLHERISHINRPRVERKDR